jgi:uncharacterized protein YcbK (DUF882 family)
MLRSRREFVQAAAALAGTLLAAPALAAPRSRTLSVVHTHTGEKLSSVYYRDGAYVPGELARINYVLRDFRTGQVHDIDPAVLDIAVDLRELAGTDAPYEIICGYRSPHTNEMLRSHSSGVAEHSLHMEGRAIDLRLPGCPTAHLRDLALGMQRGGVGYYASSDFVHVDTGRVRHW